MPYVDSTSTWAEVKAALADNAAWAVDRSVGMAKNYAVALRVYLDVWAFDRSKTGPSEQERTSLNRGLEARLQQVEQFAVASAQGSSFTRLSVRNFRGLP